MAKSGERIIDESDFERLKKSIEAFDAARDTIIRESRDITKLSKQAIYSLHREEPAEAKRQLAAAEKVIARLSKHVAKDTDLRTGGYSQSLEEYVEARAFLWFLERGTLLPSTKLPGIEPEEYLLGLCDLTGELVRYAVLRGTKRDERAVQAARDLIDAIFGQLVRFDLRNGELRKKYDGIKYNLQKVEQVLYDLKLS